MVSYSGQGRLADKQGNPTFVEYVNCDDDDDFGFWISDFTIYDSRNGFRLCN